MARPAGGSRRHDRRGTALTYHQRLRQRATLTMADSYLRVHAVNIYVKDQARSLDFYLNTLGFHIAFDAHVGSGERLLAVAPPDGTAVLTLIQAKADSPQARFVGRTTHVVFVTEDLPATYTEWRRRGVRFRNAPRLRRVVYDQTGAAARSISGSPDNRAGPIRVGRRLHALRGCGSEFVRPRELRRSQPRGRSATSRCRREAGGRAACCPRARDRHASAGAALSSATSADAHAGVRRRMRPVAPGGRRLLRFPRPWAGPSWPGHR